MYTYTCPVNSSITNLLTPTRTPSHTHTLSLPQSHTHTLSYAHPFVHTPYHSLNHTRTPFHTHTRSYAHPVTSSITHEHLFTRTPFCTQTLSLPQSHTHTPSQAHTPSLPQRLISVQIIITLNSKPQTLNPNTRSVYHSAWLPYKSSRCVEK